MSGDMAGTGKVLGGPRIRLAMRIEELIPCSVPLPILPADQEVQGGCFKLIEIFVLGSNISFEVEDCRHCPLGAGSCLDNDSMNDAELSTSSSLVEPLFLGLQDKKVCLASEPAWALVLGTSVDGGHACIVQQS